jgi:hypothetical protein
MLDRMRGSWLAINGRKAIFAAVAAAAALGTASVAQADDHHWKKWRHYYAPYYVTAPSYYVAPPVVYAPQPVPVYPEPMTYAPAYPSYSYVAPPSGVNFNFTLPLR